MHNVLLGYKQLSLQFDEKGQLLPFKEDEQVVYVLFYDEKSGVQAIANTSEDLSPDKNHKTFSRDYKYKRLGNISLLSGIDLQTGEAIPLVRDKHSSKEYIKFLQLLNAKYPKKDKIIRQTLKGIRVKTKEELIQHIYKLFQKKRKSGEIISGMSCQAKIIVGEKSVLQFLLEKLEFMKQ